jgi:hypothetical protein
VAAVSVEEPAELAQVEAENTVMQVKLLVFELWLADYEHVDVPCAVVAVIGRFADQVQAVDAVAAFAVG